jgi:hypothetical protein
MMWVGTNRLRASVTASFLAFSRAAPLSGIYGKASAEYQQSISKASAKHQQSISKASAKHQQSISKASAANKERSILNSLQVNHASDRRKA